MAIERIRKNNHGPGQTDPGPWHLQKDQAWRAMRGIPDPKQHALAGGIGNSGIGYRVSGFGWMQDSVGLCLHPKPDPRNPTPDFSQAAIFIPLISPFFTPSEVEAMKMLPPPPTPKLTVNCAGRPRCVERYAVTW